MVYVHTHTVHTVDIGPMRTQVGVMILSVVYVPCNGIM